MSSKGAAVDPSVNERRLRPVYDHLDNGNNKKALQEADRVLKKNANLQCAKVLKALALIRLNRPDEAWVLLQEVHKEGTKDDPTLQAMAIGYRELHRIDLIPDAYESALKHDPFNEELLSHLFMAYVRIPGEYKKQQQAAVTLYKSKPKNPYYFWGVMSVYLQALSAKDPKQKAILFRLAEQMCKKFIDDNRIESDQELLLYTMILEKQENYEQLYDTLSGPLGEKISDYCGLINKKKASLLLKLGRQKEAFAIYKSLIEAEPEQVTFYKELFSLAFQLDDQQNKSSDANDPSDSSSNRTGRYIEQVVDTLERSIECSVKSRKTDSTNFEQSGVTPFQPTMRGPFIAKIIFFHQLSERQRSDSSKQSLIGDHLLNRILPSPTEGGSLVDLVYQFFLCFAHKPVCFTDITYLTNECNLSQEQTSELVNKLKPQMEELVPQEAFRTLDEMQRVITFNSLLFHFGEYDELLTNEKFDRLVRKYTDFYENGLKYGENLLPTETQPADTILLLLCHIILHQAHQQIHLKPSPEDLQSLPSPDQMLLQCLIFLERGLVKSPSNHLMKVLLMGIYSGLGAANAALPVLDSLDVKHIMWDTLGHLIINPLLAFGVHKSAAAVLESGHKFFSSNYKEGADYLIPCYKYGAFSKIEEMMQLFDRLANSLTNRYITIERLFLDLVISDSKSFKQLIMDSSSAIAACNKIQWDDLRDNRDFTLHLLLHCSHDDLLKQLKEQTYEDTKLWLKLRWLLTRGLILAHQSISLSSNENVKGDSGKQQNAASNDRLKPSNAQNDIVPKTNGNNSVLGNEDSLSSFSKVVDQLKELDSQIKDIYKSRPELNVPLQSPLPSRLRSYIISNEASTKLYMVPPLHMIECLDSLLQNEQSKACAFLQSSIDELASLIDSVENSIENVSHIYGLPLPLESLVHTVETICYCIRVLQVLHEAITKPSVGGKAARKKKPNKDSSVGTENIRDAFTTAQSRMKELCDTRMSKIFSSIHNKIKTLLLATANTSTFPWLDCSDAKYLSNTSGVMETWKKVAEKLSSSYGSSMCGLKDVISNKVRCVSQLKI